MSYLTQDNYFTSGTLTMFLKWALSVPVVWWYSITQLLLRISPLLSLKERDNQEVSQLSVMSAVTHSSAVNYILPGTNQNKMMLVWTSRSWVKDMEGVGKMFVLIFYIIGRINYHHLYLLHMRKHHADVSDQVPFKWFRRGTADDGWAVELLTHITTGCLADLQSWKVSISREECGMRLWNRLNVDSASTP